MPSPLNQTVSAEALSQTLSLSSGDSASPNASAMHRTAPSCNTCAADPAASDAEIYFRDHPGDLLHGLLDATLTEFGDPAPSTD